MHRLAPWPWSLQGLGAPAQGRVVRNSEIEAEQLENGPDQPAEDGGEDSERQFRDKRALGIR